MKRLLLLLLPALLLPACETMPVSVSWQTTSGKQVIAAGYSTERGLNVHVSGK